MGKRDNIARDNGDFRAFISYSHADAAIAQKLHRKLEGYKLPKKLRTGQHNISPDGYLRPLFRDREDLPAAHDLSTAVQAALAKSGALIVICSPRAKASIWVNKEITLFRELHPERPILAAIIDGEPEQAFPEALTLIGEPLAADLRKDEDGWQLGLLKLIAGITNIPLDALVQRDAQRKMRRVTIVTLTISFVLLVMTAMTIYAFQQRNEAQYQQAQAEGLVEYMLTDLRQKLKGVGRLDVMTDVNERAIDYYDERGDLSALPAESLERRARILHAMGADDEARGDLDLALIKFTQAHKVTKTLLDREPDNHDRIFAHSQSEYWIGYIAYAKKYWPKTAHHWQNYQKFAQDLIDSDAANPKWFQEMGYAEGNLCTLQLTDYGTVEKAESHCRKAMQAVQKAYDLEPSNDNILEALINRYGWLADVNVRKGDKEEAWRLRNMQITLIDQYSKRVGPNNKLAIELELRGLIPLIKLAKNRNDSSAAKLEKRALKKVAVLEGTDEKNIIWKAYKKMLHHQER